MYPPSLEMLYRPDRMESSKVSNRDNVEAPSAAERIFFSLRVGRAKRGMGIRFR